MIFCDADEDGWSCCFWRWWNLRRCPLISPTLHPTWCLIQVLHPKVKCQCSCLSFDQINLISSRISYAVGTSTHATPSFKSKYRQIWSGRWGRGVERRDVPPIFFLGFSPSTWSHRLLNKYRPRWRARLPGLSRLRSLMSKFLSDDVGRTFLRFDKISRTWLSCSENISETWHPVYKWASL